MTSRASASSRDNQKAKRRAYFYVIMAACLWGTLGIFGKALNQYGFETFQVVLIRAGLAAITLSVFTAVKYPGLMRIAPRDATYFVGTGLLSFVFFNWCFFYAINTTSSSVAAILLYTSPAWVMVFSALLFKEALTLNKLLSLILTFTGCLLATAFVQGTAQRLALSGLLAGLGSGLGYALYSVFGRIALKKYNSLTVTLYTFVFAAAFLLPFLNLQEMAGLFTQPSVFFYSAGLGVLGTVLPFLLYTRGLAHLETSRASLIATLEPVVATTIGVLFYNEPLTVFKIAGICLVVLAVSIIREKV